jgi:hypothetical protein
MPSIAYPQQDLNLKLYEPEAEALPLYKVYYILCNVTTHSYFTVCGSTCLITDIPIWFMKHEQMQYHEFTLLNAFVIQFKIVTLQLE